MRRRVRAAAITAALIVAVPAEALKAQHFPSNEALGVMLRYIVEDGEAKGIVLGVLEADGSTRIVSHGSSGRAGLNLGPGAEFEIGSITKTFTAAVLADMISRGEVALDDPVNRYLPPGGHLPSWSGREVTLADLATHTSGISDVRGQPPGAPRTLEDLEDFTTDDLHALLPDVELQREPGTGFEYSNVGVGLLAYVLARAAGLPIAELFDTRILTPLGMTQTSFAGDRDAERLVQGFRGDEPEAHVVATDALAGAGALRSTMRDMLLYLDANVGPATSDLERAMRTAHEPRRTIGDGPAQVGLTWRTMTVNGRELVVHNGDTDGFSARLAFDPERAVGIVILTNQNEYASNLGTDLLVHEPIDERPGTTLAPTALAQLAGVYEFGGVPTIVRHEEDGLTIQQPGAVRMKLYPTADSSFYAAREEWNLLWQLDDSGSPSGVTLVVREGTVREGTRWDVVEIASPAAFAGNESIDADVASRYTGRFEIELGGQEFEYRVFVRGGRLMSRLGTSTSALLPLADHTFVVEANPSIQVTFQVVDGTATAFTLRQGDRADSGTRAR